MKWIAFAAPAVSALALAAQAGTLDDIRKRETIRLGYSETSPPFSFKSPQGEVLGYSVELCKRVAEIGRASCRERV